MRRRRRRRVGIVSMAPSWSKYQRVLPAQVFLRLAAPFRRYLRWCIDANNWQWECPWLSKCRRRPNEGPNLCFDPVHSGQTWPSRHPTGKNLWGNRCRLNWWGSRTRIFASAVRAMGTPPGRDCPTAPSKERRLRPSTLWTRRDRRPSAAELHDLETLPTSLQRVDACGN